jgi:beta-lactamase regulating signal transducer with metallopeptidase domain
MTTMMIEAALRALVFAIAVGAGLRLLRVSNVPVRKAAWSLVLLASVAMPFLMRVPALAEWSGRLGWSVPVRLNQLYASRTAVQPQAAPASPVIMASAEVPQDFQSADAVPADTVVVAPRSNAISAAPDDATVVAMPASNVSSPRFHWPPFGRMITMIYLAVVVALLLRLLWGVGAALRLWMTADLVSPLIAPEPNVRSSAKILSPVTIGSGIVLPASYTEWDMKKLRTVLAHERSHVRQLDFYLQLLAGLYTAAFWFSPLGWWLRRTLASLGEAIGDRAGIDAAASRSGYAEILLEFAAMPRQTLPGVAMARPGNLSHRIERLLNEHHFRNAFAVGRRRALVSLLLIPAALFAATVMIRVPNASAQTAPTPPAAPTPATAPAPAAAPTPVVAPAPAAAPDGESAPAVAPEAPLDQSAPPPAAAPEAPAAPGELSGTPPPPAALAPPAPRAWGSSSATSSSSWSSSGTNSSYGRGARAYAQDAGRYAYGYSGNGESYAIVEGPGNDITFSGNWDGDVKTEMEAMGKVAKGPFLWFTHEGKSYIVTDPAVLAKIRAMYKPMRELELQQEALERQQEPLERQQEALERQQEAAGNVRMPDMTKEMAEIDAALTKSKVEQDKWDTKQLAEVEKSLKAAQDQMLSQDKFSQIQEQLAAAEEQFSSQQSEIQTKLGELQGRLGELQGEAGARQGDFGAKMGELGAEEGRLGAEEGKLGAEEGRLSRQADRQVRSIIEECLRNGKAAPVPEVK